jgi:hypothetical protein
MRHHAAKVVPKPPAPAFATASASAPSIAAGGAGFAAAPTVFSPPAAVDGQNWRSFKRAHLSGADEDFLVELGALDADGNRIGAIHTTAVARVRFSTFVLEKLIAFGVLL